MNGASPEPSLGLRWGIKASFIEYVQRMPDGRGWAGDGAVPVGVNEIVFPPAEAGWRPTEDGSVDRFWAFHGEVRFTGHFGMLFVRVASPVLRLRGGRAELSVADPSEEHPSERLPIVTLKLEPHPAPEGIEVWSGKDVRLTEAGTVLFNGVYPAGEPFEPLTVVLPAPDAADRS